MKSVNEIGFSQENSYHSMKHLEKRFFVTCEQIIRTNTLFSQC